MKRGFDEALSFETIEPSETHRFSAMVSFGSEQGSSLMLVIFQQLVHNSMVITASSANEHAGLRSNPAVSVS